MNPIDDAEQDFIDIDTVIHLYLDEFKQKKKANQKVIAKMFMKQAQESDNVLSIEDIEKVISNCIPG